MAIVWCTMKRFGRMEMIISLIVKPKRRTSLWFSLLFFNSLLSPTRCVWHRLPHRGRKSARRRGRDNHWTQEGETWPPDFLAIYSYQIPLQFALLPHWDDGVLSCCRKLHPTRSNYLLIPWTRGRWCYYEVLVVDNHSLLKRVLLPHSWLGIQDLPIRQRSA